MSTEDTAMDDITPSENKISVTESENSHMRTIAEETEKLRQLQENMAQTQMSLNTTSTAIPHIEQQSDLDARSVYIGNVDYSATPEELQQLFKDVVSSVNRVTIQLNKTTGCLLYTSRCV